MAKSIFNKLEKYFWWAYILLPMFTGILSYDWLPNESYDEEKHELIASHSVETGPDGMAGSVEAPDRWRSIETGKIYSREMFSKHHREAKMLMAAKFFFYGLIGCFVFAYGRYINERDKFLQSLGKALLCNLAVAVSVIILF